MRATLRRALSRFVRERVREGRVLQRDMVARVRHLGRLRQQMAQRAERQIPEMMARVRGRVAQLLEGAAVPEERLIQETALLAERADVTEELVRLGSHLDGLGELLASGSPVGKKLDFLLQEVHREVNTIASKSSDLTMTNVTLEARADIDRLREQAQNVE